MYDQDTTPNQRREIKSIRRTEHSQNKSINDSRKDYRMEDIVRKGMNLLSKNMNVGTRKPSDNK